MSATKIQIEVEVASSAGPVLVAAFVRHDGAMVKKGSTRAMPGFSPWKNIVLSRGNVVSAALAANVPFGRTVLRSDVEDNLSASWATSKPDTLANLLPTGRLGVSMGIERDRALWAKVVKFYAALSPKG